jgi:hypothetical protein
MLRRAEASADDDRMLALVSVEGSEAVLGRPLEGDIV